MSATDAWWAGGETVALPASGTERAIFVRREGSGEPMTLLHGFPSSSHDWAKVAPALAERHALVMPDLLGFGASDKPPGHEYSIHEQVDIVEELWRREGIERTVVVGHDYSVSLVQELLARRAEGALRVELAAVFLMNGGLYPDLHRPQPVQIALADAEQGPQLVAAMTEEMMLAALRPTFAEGFDAEDDSRDIWASVSRGGIVIDRLIRYMDDRREHAQRWETALAQTDVPTTFVWGMVDPISGAHMAQGARDRVPGARVVELADVGHWPMLEAPERVVSALT